MQESVSFASPYLATVPSDTPSRHLIADHLGWFDNLTGDGANVTIEKLAKAHGVPVTRGAVGESGVFEFDGESPDEPPKSSCGSGAGC